MKVVYFIYIGLCDYKYFIYGILVIFLDFFVLKVFGRVFLFIMLEYCIMGWCGNDVWMDVLIMDWFRDVG